MALIKDNDIATFRKYVRMNFTATAVKSMPDLDAAERKFLYPILTEEVFDVLQAQVTGNAVTWTKLLNLCRAAVAPLAMWLDLPFMQTQLSDSGLKTTSTENTQAAHQWEYREVEKALISKGMEALEDLIKHLIKDGATYSWDNADTKESFFRTGGDFSPDYVYLHYPHLTFQQLKTLVREVERQIVKPIIGEDFFVELRDKVSPTADEKKAIELIKNAIAQLTIVRAVDRMPVKITPYGLMATLQSNTEAAPDAPADKEQLSILRNAASTEGNKHLVDLIEHLNKNASTEVFSNYYASTYYTAPVVADTTDYNLLRTSICVL